MPVSTDIGVRDKTSINSNGLDVGNKSIAEIMTRIQLKLRPPSMAMDAVLEERMEAIDGINVVEMRNPFPYNYPKLQYIPWHNLSIKTKVQCWLVELHVDVVKSWAYLMLDAKQWKSLLLLGIDKNIWDCFINHEYVVCLLMIE